MKDILVEEYGDKFFRQHFSMWMELFQRIYTNRGGEVCSKNLSRITAPTLVIQGTHDNMIKMRHAEHLRDNIANAR